MLKNIIGGLLAATMAIAGSAMAQSKQIKIGVIFDMSGALAAGGSNASYLGTKYAIDIINERGGVEGYKIVPIYVDAQSKTEVAINETERLVNQEKVDVVMGVFSSAQCVPMAQRLDQAKKFMWANVCVASAVFKDKNLKYIFRGQVHSDQMGEASCKFLAENSKSKFGKEIGDMKVAIIYEDGPYGAGVAMGNEVNCKQLGMQITLKEGYAATAPDLSAL
ncbi:MAG: ABC transporter substrate-binding protein, partial [Actinomycetes bacterium]